MERAQSQAKQLENTAKEELRLLNACTDMQQVLGEARELLKRTTPSNGAGGGMNGGGGGLNGGHEGNGSQQPLQQKPGRLNYSWSNYEQEACFFGE